MLLEIESLVAGYGDAVVIDDVGFRLDEGEGLAVLGRNGVGKTTLILALMGHAHVSAGAIRWRGKEICRRDASGRAALGIGWVPQERDIFASLTVEENLLVARRPGRFGLADAYAMFPRLNERRRNHGDNLSGGEQQMLAIARALMTNPRLLALDEPFEGLAPVIVEELEHSIRHLREEFGFAIIIVEQHAQDALRLSDRAIVLDRGRIVREGTSDELLADFEAVRSLISV
ncbi:branched-chain amino acid transport system ATP-binding protein [Bosea sp. CRIB-10]|uniref:ABC transporter ATP-binding protein n=1 Tax=Bosea sp. CRIB-10 TaxID=378404 RepID=UPI0008EAE67B|nr:ABC transporter ATP-binding protein [Bosea sp. CRIB-10]SFD67106.1 branched-chain amino acid transport system ATP-binding protein [Bosea sp. CRIB-10]